MRLDEILEALPEVGLRLWMLDHTGDDWHVALCGTNEPMQRFEATGATPSAAMIATLALAGVKVDDV